MNNNTQRILGQRLAILLALLLFSTGCWDSKDIDQRSLVMGVGLDAEDLGDGLLMTVELPVLISFASSSEGGGEISTASKPKIILSSTGNNIVKIIAQLEDQVWREMFFGHTKVIVVGEELARKGLAPLVDFFDRNPKLERRLKLAIANGKAQDIFTTQSAREPLASLYFFQMLEIRTPTTTIVTQNFQDILRHLEHNGDAILPRVRSEKEELIAAGGALVKDYKFIAWLGENETRATSFLFDTVSSGPITVNYEGAIYTFTIFSSKTTTCTKLDDNEQLTFTIDIKAEGYISEVFGLEPGKKVAESLDEIQSAINKMITEEVTHTLKKFQKLEVDPIGFSILVKRKYPRYWQDHNEHWKETIIPNIKFTVNTDFRIRHTGILS